MIEISVNIEEFERELVRNLDGLRLRAIPAAKTRALLRVSRSALARWTKGAAKRARVKQKLVRARSSNKPLGPDARVISVNGASIPVAITGPKGRLPRQTRNGIRASNRVYPKGFVGKSRRGRLKQTLFQREGERRYPLEELRIHMDQHVRATALPATKRAVDQRWEKEFTHELERAAQRIARRR